MKVKALIFLCAGVISGCAGGPEVPAGPVLPPGPLHGRIEQGMYHDSNDWYSVRLPYHPGEASYAVLAVNEEYPPYISYSSFVPGDNAGEYYHVYVEDFEAGNHAVPDTDHIADGAMRFFGRQIVQQRAEPIRLVEEKQWLAGPTVGLLRLYLQKVPMQTIQSRFNMPVMGEDYTAFILMYVTKWNGKVAMVWVEWAQGCGPCRPVIPGSPAVMDDPIERALAANIRADEFISSFRFEDK